MHNFFDECIKEAQFAFDEGEVPIGAVIVKDGKIIAKSRNTRENMKNIMGHAEINVILDASRLLERWNLSDCDLYVTLEPCSMCKEVIKQSRIANVYYLSTKLDYKKEYNKTQFVFFNGDNAKEYEQMYVELLSSFFKAKR